LGVPTELIGRASGAPWGVRSKNLRNERRERHAVQGRGGNIFHSSYRKAV